MTASGYHFHDGHTAGDVVGVVVVVEEEQEEESLNSMLAMMAILEEATRKHEPKRTMSIRCVAATLFNGKRGRKYVVD
jgi:hypothetical protein